MPRKSSVGFLVLTLLAAAAANQAWAQRPVSIRGKIRANGNALEGAYVAAHPAGKVYTTYVMTDRNGQFSFRGLAPGSYAVFTRIPGFRIAQKNGVAVQAGREAVADFQVEAETNFLERVEQASNAELLESFPLSPTQRESLDHRCTDCHGEYYLAKSRFSLKDWELIVASMDDQAKITPAGDLSPPTRLSRPSQRDAGAENPAISDPSIARLLAQIRGPDSPDFSIQFSARATGNRTRAVVTEYQIPRLGATPRAVTMDPRGGYVWYTDWRANFLGRIDIKAGEIKEYPIPGKEDRPPGFQYLRWDPLGYLLAGQIWSGQGVRFDVKNEKVANIWSAPIEWARTGSVEICRNPDGRLSYMIGDGLARRLGWIFNPETGTRKEIQLRAGGRQQECNAIEEDNDWDGGWRVGGGKRALSYRDPATGKTTEFPLPNPWARPYNAVGDPVRKVGWTAPDAVDRLFKVEVATGRVTEFPLPSHGKEIRNIEIELAANPPAVWFVNQRLGRIVRFQEAAE